MKRKQRKIKSIADFPIGGITAAMIADSYLMINDADARRMMKNGEIPSYKSGRNHYTTRDLIKIKFHGAIPEKVWEANS